MAILQDKLSDYFEGSAFVWQGFKQNPALSIFGSPLVVLEAAFLPVRAIMERRERRDFERLQSDSTMPGLYPGYHNRAPRRYYQVPQYMPYTGHLRFQEHAYSDDDQTKSAPKPKLSKLNVKRESVLYPSWRLPVRSISLANDEFWNRYDREGNGERSQTTLDPPTEPSHTPKPGKHSGTESKVGTFRKKLSRGRKKHADGVPGEYVRLEDQTRAQRANEEYQNPLPYPNGHAQPAYFAQPDARQPYGNPPTGGYAPAPANSVHTSASAARYNSRFSKSSPREPSVAKSSRHGSHISRTATFSGAPVSEADDVDDDDRESYMSQDRRSWGSYASARSQKWAPPPSTIYTHPQYKPTHRADSVAPNDSISMQGIPPPSQHPYEYMHSAKVPSRKTRAPSRKGSRPTTILEEPDRESRSSRASGSRVFREPDPNGPPPRSRSISTTNTGDLPDTPHGSSRSRNTASRSHSYHTATGVPDAAEIPEYEDADSVEPASSRYDTISGTFGEESGAYTSSTPRNSARLASQHRSMSGR